MKQNKGFILLITIAASLGGLLFGYDTGVINGTQFFFSEFFGLDAVAKGWAVSSALIGCVVGAVASGVLSSAIGRKMSLIIAAVLFTISAFGSGLPSVDQFNLLIFFRVLGGLGIGIASMNAPTYIAEIAPADKRGTLVTYYQLAIVVGFFVVFLATYFIGEGRTDAENIAQGWRYMFWSELIPCILFLGLMFLTPKSPRWLALKGKNDEAKSVLMKIYGDEAVVNNEFSRIKESLDEDIAKPKLSIFSKGVFTIIVIGTVLSALQQFTGINAVLYYGADIFESALGMGKDQVLQQQILLAGVNLLFTFIAMFTVDKLGRKPLLTIGGIGMLLGFLLMGWTLYSSDYSTINAAGNPSISSSEGILCLIGVLTFIGSFAMSMGPIVWVMLSEMFPNNIRSVAMSIAVAAQWIANAFVSGTFPSVVESQVNSLKLDGGFWNNSLPYFIFSAFILFIIFFVRKYIPETKGKSLEEVEAMWEEKFNVKF